MSSRLSRLGFALFIFMVLCYFALQIVQSLSQPFSTATVYWYQAEDAISVSGWVVREEQVLPDQSGVLDLPRQEGERVGKGQVVARRYDSQESRGTLHTLTEKQEELAEWQELQSSLLGADSLLRLDSSLKQSLIALQLSLAERNGTEREENCSHIQASVLRRSYAYGEEEELQARIDALKAEIQTLKSNTTGRVETITSPRAGLYSAETDGYESVLTPTALASFSPSDLQGIRPDRSSSSSIGRLILGHRWYFAMVLNQQDTELVRQAKQERQAIALRFAREAEQDFPMTIESIGMEHDGLSVVVLSSDEYLSEVTLLRHQSADIIFYTQAGLRVPTNAVQVQTSTDSNGVEQKSTGVYCVSGATALYKPVDILYLGEDYTLVAAGEADKNRSSRILRSGDKVLLHTEELYDGKVVT